MPDPRLIRRPARSIAIAAPARSSTTMMKWLFAAAGLAAALALAGAAHATAHDGAWKVTIITQSGDCDPAYSYPVRVSGGKVSYAGDGSFDISGSVADTGTVSVAIAGGEQRAEANGKLAGNTGSGKWSGKSATTTCSGRWEAIRAG